MVTKEMMEKYEQLRSSGIFNMLSREAIEWMEDNTNCSYDDYMDIISNYLTYMDKYKISRS